MLKNIIFRNCQRKINKLKPQVSILLNKEIPTPALKIISNFAPIVVKVNAYEQELESKPEKFFKDKTNEFKSLIQERIAKA